MPNVLIAYDRTRAVTLRETWFDDPEAARGERLALELASNDEPQIEVVLLQADSRADVERSHARYFAPASLDPDRLFPRAKGTT